MYYTTLVLSDNREGGRKNRKVLYFVYNIDTKLKFSLYI